MEVVMTLVIIVALCVAGGLWGVDSRPLDPERPTRWLWPAERQK
jgi:hypothetical protein